MTSDKETRRKIRGLEKRVGDLNALVDTLQTALRRAETVLKDSDEYGYVFAHSAKWAINEKTTAIPKPTVDRTRHLLKTLTWRAIGTLDTVILGWLVSGDPRIGLTIGSLELITKMILYYLHERTWYKIDFGIRRNK